VCLFSDACDTRARDNAPEYPLCVFAIGSCGGGDGDGADGGGLGLHTLTGLVKG
jgi:hypothetical protein